MSPAADENPDSRHAPGGPFRRVLVAFDGSAGSIVALRTAAALVGGGQGHVVALSVLTATPRREAEKDGPAQSSDQVRRLEATFETARAAISHAQPARVGLHTMQARQVAESLCDYATEHGFDLLVIGRHGDGGLMHPKLGHVADTAVRNCMIPVLLVGAG